MDYDITGVSHQIGNEFYFIVVRDDGVKGEIQLNIKLLAEDYEQYIQWWHLT